MRSISEYYPTLRGWPQALPSSLSPHLLHHRSNHLVRCHRALERMYCWVRALPQLNVGPALGACTIGIAIHRLAIEVCGQNVYVALSQLVALLNAVLLHVGLRPHMAPWVDIVVAVGMEWGHRDWSPNWGGLMWIWSCSQRLSEHGRGTRERNRRKAT